MTTSPITLSASDITKLKAARDVIDRVLTQAAIQAALPQADELSRGPDGRHLDDEGVKKLYRCFAAGMTPYGAHIQFGISYRAASLRYESWKREQAQAA